MLHANFNIYSNYVTDTLYQWDIDQDLVIEGLNLSVAPEIHFSNAKMDRAIVKQSTIESGVVTVRIPNSLLQDSLTIKAYIGVYEGTSFNVIDCIEIPIIARERPSDYTISDSDEEIYSFKALENQIANIVANANSTEGNSELVDIRKGADGKIYTSAGEAVREQVKDLKQQLQDGLDNVQIEMDDSMSDTSENAVKNKVVKAYVDESVAEALENVSVNVDDEMLVQIENDVKRHENILNGYQGISITDLSVYEQIVGLPNQNGASANWVIKEAYKHIVIPVPETGCKLRMTANANSNLLYIGLKSYTQPTVATSPLEFSDDTDWNMRWSLLFNTSVEKDIADDVKYILIVTLNNGVDAYPSSFEIYKDGESGGLVGDVATIKSELKPFKNKNLFAFGDSITYGYITIDGVKQDVRYTEVIKEKLGCNIENYGSSGAGIGRLCTIMTGGVVDRKSSVDPSQPTLCTDYSDADIVTIMIGTNNGIYVAGVASTFDDIPKIYGATVKTIADGGTIEYNGQTISTIEDYWALFPNSFHGNLALCIEWIMWKKPTAKIYLITPPYNNISNWRNFIHTEVRPALLEIGAYYGVEVIDAQINSGVNLHNLLDYTFDGVHFNQEGCKKWGDYIAGQIK